MTKAHELNRQAEGKISIAIQRLAERYPFHCKILERFKVQPSLALDTIAVTVAADDVLLLYNAAFVLGITLPMLTGVLLHEVHHVLFGHVLADPADYPDDDARVIAEEVTVNEFVNLPMPEGAITLATVPGLPPMESTPSRYARLAGKVTLSSPEPQVNATASGGQSGDAASSSQRRPTGDQRAESGQGATIHTATSSDRRPTRNAKPCNVSKRNVVGRTVDDHSVWAEAKAQRERSAEAIRAAVEGAVWEVGIPLELAEAVAALGVGEMPGAEEQQVSKARAGNVDWRRQLRTYVGQLLSIHPVFNRPSRRFPELVGIVPGKRRRSDKPKIMAAIDTSGSITAELLDNMNAELASLAKNYEVTVVECDAAIQAVYKYRRITSVEGRGGTDFRLVFEPEFLRRHQPDLVIYFTDGMGPAPASKPRMPVIWCLVHGGKQPAEWGRVIRLDSICGQDRTKKRSS